MVLTVEERKKKILIRYWNDIRYERVRGHAHAKELLEKNIDGTPLYKLLATLIKGLKTYAPKKKELLASYLNAYVVVKEEDKRNYLYSKIEDFFRDMESKFSSHLLIKK